MRERGWLLLTRNTNTVCVCVCVCVFNSLVLISLHFAGNTSHILYTYRMLAHLEFSVVQ